MFIAVLTGCIANITPLARVNYCRHRHIPVPERRNDRADREIGIILYPDAQEAAVLGVARHVRAGEPQKRGGEAAAEDVPPGVSGWAAGAGGWQHGPPRRPAGAAGSGIPVAPKAAAAYTASLNDFHVGGGILTTVRAGSFLLAEAGLLTGRAATIHWAFQDELSSPMPVPKGWVPSDKTFFTVKFRL